MYFPSDEELKKVLALYAKIGLPGTVGSMDCTHLTWSNAAKHIINTTRGKEKEATLSFQVVCSHTRLIFHCSNFFFGQSHDQTVAKNDWFSKWIIDGGLNNIQYVVYDRDGRPRRCYGGHVLVDGGYQKIGCWNRRNRTSSMR